MPKGNLSDPLYKDNYRLSYFKIFSIDYVICHCDFMISDCDFVIDDIDYKIVWYIKRNNIGYGEVLLSGLRGICVRARDAAMLQNIVKSPKL